MSDRRDIDDLKAQAFARAGQVLAALGIRERVRAGYISMCNPKRKDARPSFTIFVKGGSIAFRDEANTEIKGDVIQLIAYLRDWTHLPNGGFLESKRWLEDLFGIHTMTPEERRQDAEKARRIARNDARKAARDAAKYIGIAKQVFFGAAPLSGTDVERHLLARGIRLDELPKGPRGGERTPGSLRFIARERHVWEGPRDDPRNGEESFWSCMVACCVDPATGETRAIHRTWLRPGGADKAPVTPPRKCWPGVGGLIIPLWKGETWLSVPEAIKAGLRETVVLAEGIETALSAVMAAPQYRTWAVIALGNLQRIKLPECIDSVMLCRENDWIKPQAVASFEAGKRALERHVTVAEIPTYGGNDLNDNLR